MGRTFGRIHDYRNQFFAMHQSFKPKSLHSIRGFLLKKQETERPFSASFIPNITLKAKSANLGNFYSIVRHKKWFSSAEVRLISSHELFSIGQMQHPTREVIYSQNNLQVLPIRQYTRDIKPTDLFKRSF